MRMLKIGYNFDTLDRSFNEEQPFYIEENGDTGIIALSLEDAEQLLEELPEMIKAVKAKRYDNIAG